jgi:hypothetical protein
MSGLFIIQLELAAMILISLFGIWLKFHQLQQEGKL